MMNGLRAGAYRPPPRHAVSGLSGAGLGTSINEMCNDPAMMFATLGAQAVGSIISAASGTDQGWSAVGQTTTATAATLQELCNQARARMLQQQQMGDPSASVTAQQLAMLEQQMQMLALQQQQRPPPPPPPAPWVPGMSNSTVLLIGAATAVGLVILAR